MRVSGINVNINDSYADDSQDGQRKSGNQIEEQKHDQRLSLTFGKGDNSSIVQAFNNATPKAGGGENTTLKEGSDNRV